MRIQVKFQILWNAHLDIARHCQAPTQNVSSRHIDCYCTFLAPRHANIHVYHDNIYLCKVGVYGQVSFFDRNMWFNRLNLSTDPKIIWTANPWLQHGIFICVHNSSSIILHTKKCFCCISVLTMGIQTWLNVTIWS